MKKTAFRMNYGDKTGGRSEAMDMFEHCVWLTYIRMTTVNYGYCRDFGGHVGSSYRVSKEFERIESFCDMMYENVSTQIDEIIENLTIDDLYEIRAILIKKYEKGREVTREMITAFKTMCLGYSSENYPGYDAMNIWNSFAEVVREYEEV